MSYIPKRKLTAGISIFLCDDAIVVEVLVHLELVSFFRGYNEQNIAECMHMYGCSSLGVVFGVRRRNVDEFGFGFKNSSAMSNYQVLN